MAEYNSRQSGERIDNGIDKAFSNEIKIADQQTEINALSESIEVVKTIADDARSVADLAAIKAAMAGARIEEINTALLDRIISLENKS